jgi:hypothetical protein
MDDQELTPWQEINPAVLAGQRQQLSQSSNVSTALRSCVDQLEPATTSEIVSELTPCLAQVAPSGMSQSDRDEWLMAAGQTISEAQLPVDLLKRGCKAARHNLKVDHPCRIVAAILDEVSGSMKFRRDNDIDRRTRVPASHRLTEASPKYCTGEEAAAILAEFGLTSVFGKSAR